MNYRNLLPLEVCPLLEAAAALRLLFELAARMEAISLNSAAEEELSTCPGLLSLSVLFELFDSKLEGLLLTVVLFDWLSAVLVLKSVFIASC